MVPKSFFQYFSRHTGHLILFRMMINDGPKSLVVVAVGVSAISYDAVYQQLTRSSTQLESKMKNLCFFSLF